MRILVAPQEFKGTLAAAEAARAIAEGLRRALPQAELDLAPMADGGPGTVDVLLARPGQGGGERCVTRVTGPLGESVDAAWALLEDGAAVIEMAAASGLTLVPPGERDPLRASTFGTGELIRAALDAGAKSIVVGLGGSATNDGGAGLAQALGVRLLDGEARELPRPAGGGDLARLARIDVSGLDSRAGRTPVLAASDVTNPLCGPHGASAVYGPQKGATAAQARALDAALGNYARIIERDIGFSVADAPGAGAAGGLGAGLIAFLRADIRPGAALIAEAIDLPGRIARSDAVITGEGRLDAQTAFGKTVQTVARLAKEAGKPVIALAGVVTAGREDLAAMGVDAAYALFDSPPLEPPRDSAERLASLAERVGRDLAADKVEGVRLP